MLHLLPFSLDQTGCSKLLTIAPALNKRFFQRGNLPVEQVVRLMDKANNRIGANSSSIMLQPRRIELPTFLIGEISQSRLICMFSPEPFRHFANSIPFLA